MGDRYTRLTVPRRREPSDGYGPDQTAPHFYGRTCRAAAPHPTTAQEERWETGTDSCGTLLGATEALRRFPTLLRWRTVGAMSRFACFLSAPTGAPPLSDEVLEAHGQYLQGLLDDGALIAAGPIADPPEGLVIFDAEDAEAARALADADPAVSDGGQVATIREWTVAFER